MAGEVGLDFLFYSVFLLENCWREPDSLQIAEKYN